VSTDVGSVSDIVKSGIGGTLVGCSSSELMRGLEELIDDEDLRVRYGVSGKERASELFSSRSMVVAHEKLYRDLTN
jgi:glycosyltransferase involved in cell wall biosynthesis